MNALGASILAVLATTVLLGSRRWALAAMMAGVLFLTQAQTLNVAGFHLFAIRLLEVVGLVRVIARGELMAIVPTRVDRAVLLLYGFTIAVFLSRSDEAWATIIGVSVDAVASYFICRALLRSIDDLAWSLQMYMVLLIPFVFLLLIEVTTLQNPFASMGGLTFVERGDRIRCMASFRHPSLVGTAGAAFLPLYLALLRIRTWRTTGFLGCLLCAAIIFCANSGGPVSAAAFGVAAWSSWSLRRHLSAVRRALVATLILLAIFMNAPIWYLPAKASSLSGGDGWHRSFLMETAANQFRSWWLAGIDMSATSNWFGYTLAATGSADITNQYLFFGLTAGIGALVLFINVLVKAFSALGRSMEALRESSPDAADSAAHPATSERLYWGLGCCIVAHAANWFGITYNFDQTYVLWSFQLAAVSVASGALRASVLAPVATPRYI